MRIIVHHRIASRDGQSVHLEEMVAAFRAQGHAVTLVGPAGFARMDFGASDTSIGRLKAAIPAALYELLEIAYNLAALVRLARAVRRVRPDIVYERYSLFLFAGLMVRRATGIPLLLEVNSPLCEERAAHDGLALAGLGRRAQRALWRGADHVLPVTDVLARMVVADGVDPSRVTVVPNGIDPERFGTPPPVGGDHGRVTLGFTGFVRGWNGVGALLELVARTRDTLDLDILIVGDGPARAELEAKAASLGIADRLTITGTVARDEVAARIARFDIAVVPATTPYASPLKLFEYLALGRAVVAPDSANIREILVHDRNARLFEPGSPAALEAAVVALAGDQGLRRRLGDAARETISARALTWQRNAEKVVAITERLAERRV